MCVCVWGGGHVCTAPISVACVCVLANLVRYVCGNTGYGVEKYFTADGYPISYTVRAPTMYPSLLLHSSFTPPLSDA